MERKEIKRLARETLSKKWLEIIVAMLVVYAISMVVVVPILGFFVMGPLQVGFIILLLKTSRGESSGIGVIFDGFGKFLRNGLLALLKAVYLFLWGLLLFIPMFIKTYSYAMADFIAAENPEYSANQCITESRKLMDGHKWDLFVLQLSFIGWMLLGVITLGIAYLYVTPYMQCANAEFYRGLKGEYEMVSVQEDQESKA